MTTETEIVQFLEDRNNILQDKVRSLKDLRTKLSRECGRLEREAQRIEEEVKRLQHGEEQFRIEVLKRRREAERYRAKMQTKPEHSQFVELLRLVLNTRTKMLLGTEIDISPDDLREPAETLLSNTGIKLDGNDVIVTIPEFKIVRG